MPKINNTKSKKCRIPLIFSMIGIGGIFLYQYLTFIPEYSKAITLETPIYDDRNVDIFPSLNDISNMSELTSEVCRNTRTPEASETVTVPSKLLIDDRVGANGQKYWVSKLSDGNCWMTQNMDYSYGISGGYFVDKGLQYIPAGKDTWQGVPNGGASSDPTMTEPVSGSVYNSHYLIGNYYTKTQAMQACHFEANDDWQLPSGDNDENGSFKYLLDSYSIGSNGGRLARVPFYFQYSGNYTGNWNFVGNAGYYWSRSVKNQFYSYYLYFDSVATNALAESEPGNAFPARCMVMSAPAEPDIDNPTLSVSIPNIITLDVYSDPEDKDNNVVSIDTNTNDINTGEFIAEVSANTSYKITLNSTSEDSEGTSLIGKKDNGELSGHSIPTLTTNTDASGNTTYIQPQKGISSWGIRTCTSLLLSSCDTEQYKPLPSKNTSTTPNPFYTGTPGSNQSTLFQIGIGISPNLPSGTYSTSIQVTASPN